MAARKVKVQHNGAEIEIELPDGWLSPEEGRVMFTQERLDQIISERVAQAKRSRDAELLKDNDFKAKAAKEWGLHTDPPKPEKGDREQAVKDAIAEVERTRITPLTTERDGLKARIESILGKALAGRIMGAAAGKGVKEAYRKPLPGSKVAPIVTILESLFGFDEKLDDHFAKNPAGEGWRVSPVRDANRAHPWMTVDDLFDDMKANPEYADLFEATGQKGASVKDAKAAAGKTTIDGNDPVAFGKNVDGILKGDVVVT